MAKSPSLINKLKNPLAYNALRMLASISLRANHKFATRIAALMNLIPNRTRDVTYKNIALCFPDLSEKQQKALAYESLVEAAKGSAEMGWFWFNPDKALAMVRQVDGADALRDTLAANKPAIILAPHLGAFEVLNFWVSSHFELHVMYKPAKIKAIDELMLKGRKHFGSHLYPATSRGVIGLMRRLKKGDVLTAVLPDQVPDEGSGIFSPFYGLPAYTGTLAPRMAQQTKARIFMGWAERLPNAEGFHIYFTEPDPAIYDPDLHIATTAMNHSIETMIAKAPAQYMWGYKRFRRATEGHADPYKQQKPD